MVLYGIFSKKKIEKRKRKENIVKRDLENTIYSGEEENASQEEASEKNLKNINVPSFTVFSQKKQ